MIIFIKVFTFFLTEYIIKWVFLRSKNLNPEALMSQYILRLKPYISETIWGGRKLIDDFGIETEKSNAAEGWMLSCLDMGPSIVADGEYAGKTLPQVIGTDPLWCGENIKKYSEFPVLIKFIDAMDDLSVQVHPTKEYCEKTGRGRSKTECWYIIDCEEDASLLLGFNEEITKEKFKSSIEDGSLLENVRRFKVKPGDFFFIDSGTLHAICKGVLLAEVQESSNTTYRIFDYNRVGKDGNKRELHVADAVEVTKTVPYEGNAEKTVNKPNEKNLLVTCDLFSVWNYSVNGKFTDTCDSSSFVSLLVMSGKGTLRCSGECIEISKGDSLFIPAGFGEYTVEGNTEILETRI